MPAGKENELDLAIERGIGSKLRSTYDDESDRRAALCAAAFTFRGTAVTSDKLVDAILDRAEAFLPWLQERPTQVGEFMECDTCRAKPGSPYLCQGCLHNRALIDRLLRK